MTVHTSDITVITPLVSYENTDPLWMFLISCKRFGITPTFYGKGATYGGWVDIMLVRLMEAARTCPTSHMLYTDSRDAFFLAGLDEVVEKYNAMGAPPLLMGSDCAGFSTYQAWYDKVPWDITKAFPYFQVGGMVCEAQALYQAIAWMFERDKTGGWGEMPGDNPPWWCNFMAERPGELVIDHDCMIFQNCSNCMEILTPTTVVSIGGQWLPDSNFVRLRNAVTYFLPCILHFNGGYTSQETGKWDRMEKMWRALGYKENPPWQN
jgi:hypothetical protein